MTRRNSNSLQELLRTFPLAWRLFQDRQVTPLLKVIPILAVIYLLIPIDLLPDVIPVGGQLDDIALLLIALRLFVKLSPPELVARYSGDTNFTPFENEENVVDGEWRTVDSNRQE